MNDIFEKDRSGAMVSPDEPGYDRLIASIFETMKLAYELNDGFRTPDEARRYLSRITGREIDESVTLLPPFYVDFGKNIRIGKRCWIQQGCTFFDRGGITLGDDVFIAPKVNLVTINHDPDPGNRSATYGRRPMSRTVPGRFRRVPELCRRFGRSRAGFPEHVADEVRKGPRRGTAARRRTAEIRVSGPFPPRRSCG